MINVYPYPFSKNVKSLPDPPPAKSREIKDIKNKIYTNDYSWLIEAINNLKKCFHLCNLCSQKFKYMRQIARDCNVHYEHNWDDQILNNEFKEGIDCKFFEEEEKDNSSSVCTDTKHNILKINGRGIKNPSKCCDHDIEVANNKNINEIVFSNSLFSNKNEILSFDRDVYIFVGDHFTNYKNKGTVSDNKNYHIDQNEKNSNISNDFSTQERINARVEEMSIHIKRHFKDSISYFACEHIKFSELQNLTNENSNYDKIDIFAYDKANLSSMNECVLNLKKENDLIHLTQPINDICTNEEIKEKVEEIHKFYINVIKKANEEKLNENVQNDEKNYDKGNIANVISKILPGFSTYNKSVSKNKNNKIPNSKNVDCVDYMSKSKGTKAQAGGYPPVAPLSLINELRNKLKNRKVSCCLKDLEKEKKDFSSNYEYGEDEQVKNNSENNLATHPLHSKSSAYWNNKNSLYTNGSNSKKNKIINDVNIEEFMRKLSQKGDRTPDMQKLNTFKYTKFDTKQNEVKDSIIQNDSSVNIMEGRNISNNSHESIIKESCFLKTKEKSSSEINILPITKTINLQNNNFKIKSSLEDNNLYKKDNSKDDFSDFSEEKINHIYDQRKLRTIPSDEFLECKKDLEYIEPDESKWNVSSSIRPFSIKNKLLNIPKRRVVDNSTNMDSKTNYNIFRRENSSDVAVQTNYDSNLVKDISNIEKFNRKGYNPIKNNYNVFIKNDKECEKKQNSIVSIPILKSIVCGLKNYENSKIRNPFTETPHHNSLDDSNNCENNEEMINGSKMIDGTSVYRTMEEKKAQEALKNETHGNVAVNIPYYQCIKKQDYSLVMSPLRKNSYMYPQNKDIESVDTFSRKKESKHHNNLSFFRNPFSKESVCYNNLEKPVYFSSVESEKHENTKIESIDELKNTPMGNVFNLCKQPNEINVHNRIYASDSSTNSPSENKRVIYFNNNYFFNIDKESSLEHAAHNPFPLNNTSSNLKKLDLDIYQNGSDGCSIKCLHNTLPNERILMKESSFVNSSYHTSVSNENITKLQKLRNKHFKNNELHCISYKKKPSISKRFFDIKKNYYPYEKSFIKEDTNIIKEDTYYDYSRKKRANHVTMISDVPESPQEQEKIPKPFASQLDIQIQAYLKKTPSYPFEEYEF